MPVKMLFIGALERGVAAQKQGKHDEAEEIYRSVLELQSRHSVADYDLNVVATICNNLGYALQQKGELNAALDSYQNAVKFKPDYYEAFNNLGFTQYLLGDLDAAISSYDHAINFKPDYELAYFNKGRTLQDKGDLRNSIECYRFVVKKRPYSADALNALGAALQLDGDLEAAIDTYNRTLKISPTYVEAHNNPALALQAKGDSDASIESCRRALEIKPDYANALNTLGHAQYDKGELDSAIDSYRDALKLQPDSAHAYNNLGNALREAGKYEEAIECFDALNQPHFKEAVAGDPTKHLFWVNAKSQALECLYLLGNYSELESRLNVLAKEGDINRRIAAVSAFVTHQLKIENPHSFCKKPLDFFHIGNLSDYTSDVDSFIAELIVEANQLNQVWEPQHGVTKSGYQTPNTIFQTGGACKALEKILRKEIESYYRKFSSEDCAFINLWPSEYDLKGWLARLLKNGHQRSHIHPAGWLSGVVYLKTINAVNSDEGAIELSLHGYDLPVLDSSYPRRVHRPKKGEIILFPSSVFHGTVPFNEDTERSVIAFDALPSSKSGRIQRI